MRELTEKQKRSVYQTLDELQTRCRPLLVGFGGSIAYGLDGPDSDIDIRGIFLNPPEEWIGLRAETERVELKDGDTVLYGLRKAMKLMLNGNPNVIELLGLRREHILICTDEGRLILDKAPLFLSQQAAYTFGAFALNLRRRLQKEVYEGKTPAKTLNKEMAQLIRIYAMGIDLLEYGEVVTYREQDHALLMDIRTGKYLDKHRVPTAEYERLLETCMGGFRMASGRTHLPMEPDWAKANELTMEIVRRIL